MDYDTPLTTEGWARLRKVAEYESWGYDTYREALHEELGATQLSKSHVYTFPCIHENRRHAEPGYKDTYVLKVCSRCLHGKPLGYKGHEGCFLDNEVGVWDEAVRRDDDSLFCPIVAADRGQGWMLMEHCDHLSELPDSESFGVEVRNSYYFQRHMGRRLRERGWLPSSTKRMDIEVMAFEGRPVVIDYENLYHESWRYDPLHWRWSQFLRWDATHTLTTDLAIDENERKVGNRAAPIHGHQRKREQIEELHYSRTSVLTPTSGSSVGETS